MAPKKAGFNWAGYLAPFAAVGGGAGPGEPAAGARA